MANGVRIYWGASTDPSVARYELYRTSNPNVAPTPVIEVLHTVPGANWDARTSRFFYNDPDGALTDYYRVIAVTDDAVALGDTGLFSPGAAQPAAVNALIALDHDYGGPDNFQAIAPGGAPLAFVKIFVYGAVDYAAGRRQVVVGQTETDLQGRWRSPVLVTPGLDYVIVFQKQSEWGPNAVTVTVSPLPVP